MEDKETINILIARLLSKDDEILSPRNRFGALQREQKSGNTLVLSKLDRALEELKYMRRENKKLSNRLSQALEALKNMRTEDLARQKRQPYGRKSEKKSSLPAAMQEKDLKEDKDDFDGSAPSAQ